MILIPLWAACSGGCFGCDGSSDFGADCPADLEVAPHETIGTILELSFTTETSTTSTVTVDGVMSDAVEGTEHHHLILGQPGPGEVAFTLDWVDGDEALACEGTGTNNGPSGLPTLDAVTYDQDALSPERYLLLSALGEGWALMIVNRDGEPVWWFSEDTDEIHPDVDFVEGSNDLYFNTFSEDHGEDIGALRRIGVLGNDVAEIRTEWAHHAFTQIGDGTVGYMTVDIRDWYDDDEGEEVSVVGDAIWEFEAPDGDHEQVISSWDVLDPYKHGAWDSNFYPQGHDWTHGNAMVHHRATDSYLFSFGHIDTILEVDRTATEDGHYAIDRQFGGLGGYPVAEGSKSFNFQHDPNIGVDGTLLMISTTNAKDPETTCLEYSIDDDAELLEEVAEFGADQGFYAFALGMCRRLDNGNTLVNYGSAGVIQEFGPDGELVWELYSGTGNFFGQSWLVDDLYAGE